MIIQTRGDGRKKPLAEKVEQLQLITSMANHYKTVLEISQADLDRLDQANEMNKYIHTVRNLVKGWHKRLTSYDWRFRTN